MISWWKLPSLAQLRPSGKLDLFRDGVGTTHTARLALPVDIWGPEICGRSHLLGIASSKHIAV